jgi:predicted Zn-dependent peptidase
MTSVSDHIEHRRLNCGIDLVVVPLPGRPVTAIEIRVLAGYAFEDSAHLGVAHVLIEAINKGTAKRDGRALNDAFDEIGASHASRTGREMVAFSCVCLPEFMQPAIDLHAEMICTPTFPEDACEMAVELTRQSLAAMEDDPQGLAKKLLHRQAYGEPLGRHVLGEPNTLEQIDREAIVQHWKNCYTGARMQVAVAGAVEINAVADTFERTFSSLGAGSKQPANPLSLQFIAECSHHHKELEQEQIALCFPGASARDEDLPVERVTIAVLGGGMSGRLFTEVREKQGLVYWVGAWSDQPRQGGMVHVGASSTPENVDRTYTTLLRELDRLGNDVTQAEIDRAITGIVTRSQTQGDITRAKAAEFVEDLFYYDRPIPTEEKLDKIRAVTVPDVCRYLKAHPRESLSVVTVGPKELKL